MIYTELVWNTEKPYIIKILIKPVVIVIESENNHFRKKLI